ncbi:unnamed protein product [Rhizophagus irregularis]|nr:unnamed protein product [Rhizophagus irregularis]
MSDNTYENVNPEMIRKRKAKAQETPEQRQARLNRESERKRQKRAKESENKRNERLESLRKRRNNKKEMEKDDERVIRLAHESNRKRVLRTQPDNRNMHVRSTSSTTISEDDHKVLQKFRNKMDNIQYNTCPECNERIPDMTLIKGECHRCHNDKKTPKKFSADNNMDPGEVPDELQGLTDIEEMLIAQVFTVMSVYRLRDILVVRRESANDTSGFRDFTVRREKIAKALYWLKANNPYYEDIIIDDEILKSLPQNGSIINQIHQIRSDQIIDEMDDISNENENGHDEGDAITRSFVPAIPSTQRENAIINDTLDRIQSNEQPVLWPEIDGSPINEFQIPGYIARAFLTLYPYIRKSREKCSSNVHRSLDVHHKETLNIGPCNVLPMSQH